MKETINLSKDFVEILENHGSCAFYQGEPKYYFFPYWFEKTEDDGVFILHMLDHLPNELLDTLNFMRSGDSKEPLKQY